jgi:hypothetical protein
MIIKAHYSKLKEKCTERGWNLEEVMDCVILKTGDMWVINTDHPKYPMYHKSGRVGTELKKILSIIGIRSGSNCSCNERALKMDQMGVEWCEKNIETISQWLHEEAEKRHLPFFKSVAIILIKKAIKNTKQKQ